MWPVLGAFGVHKTLCQGDLPGKSGRVKSCVARLMLAYGPAGTDFARLPVIVSKIDLFMCISVLEGGEGGS